MRAPLCQSCCAAARGATFGQGLCSGALPVINRAPLMELPA
ncbi:hypothetical protein SC1_02830 [Sphingopyxis sp. C-1]|nr:hypothetical protein SC1_02830 [Sphingopyxis sp. C-1]